MKNILALLLLVGCGDPAAQFVGNWSGTSLIKLTQGGQTQSTPSSVVLPISEDKQTGNLVFADSCGSVAHASGGSFTVQTYSGCVAIQPTSTACGFIQSLTFGEGSISAGVLTITEKGTITLSQCPNGDTGTGDFEQDFTGTK
jgi:hypothetical protein